MSLLRLASGILFIIGAIFVAVNGSIEAAEFWMCLGFATWVLSGAGFDTRV